MGWPNCVRPLRVIDGAFIDCHGCANGSPGNPEASLVETLQRSAQALSSGKQVFIRNSHVIHDEIRCNGSAERKLLLDLWRLESLAVGFDNKTSNIVADFCPDYGDVRNRPICDPTLGSVKNPASRRSFGTSFHPAGIRAVIRFSEPEAADLLALWPAEGASGLFCSSDPNS